MQLLSRPLWCIKLSCTGWSSQPRQLLQMPHGDTDTKASPTYLTLTPNVVFCSLRVASWMLQAGHSRDGCWSALPKRSCVVSRTDSGSADYHPSLLWPACSVQLATWEQLTEEYVAYGHSHPAPDIAGSFPSRIANANS